MNWKKLYAICQTWVVIGLASLVSAGCGAFAIAGLCRITFKLEENSALLWIGLPIFFLFLILSLIYLPDTLRKTGVLSDQIEKFGSWFT